jgi:hypothetical protein
MPQIKQTPQTSPPSAQVENTTCIGAFETAEASVRLLLESTHESNPMDTSQGNPTDTPPGDPMDFLQGLLKSTQGSNPMETPEGEPMNFQQSLLKSTKLKLKDLLPIFLQDVSDADNFASVAAYIKCIGRPTKARPLHFVLVQRADSFKYPKYHPGCRFSFPGPVSSDREEPCPEDSLLAAQHGAARLREFLTDLGVSLDYVFIYDGGLTDKHSNLSNLVHASDYLLRDLISGNTTSPGDYIRLQSVLNGEVTINETTKKYDFSKESSELQKARQDRTREYIKEQLAPYAVKKVTLLRPLSDLLKWLAEEDPKSFIVAFALAPLTGLANLFAMDERGILRDRLVRVFGQLFAWDNCAPYFWTRSPQGVNILKNQFNVDCDPKAVEYVLEQLKRCINLLLVLVPTEANKDPRLESFLHGLHQKLKATPFEKLRPIEQLWFQWNSIKGDKAQVIFDPMVIYLWHCLSQIDIDQDDSTANELFEMKPASVSIPGNQELFKWDRTVFLLKPTESDSPEPTESDSPGLKISAALKLKDDAIKTVEDLLVQLLELAKL